MQVKPIARLIVILICTLSVTKTCVYRLDAQPKIEVSNLITTNIATQNIMPISIQAMENKLTEQAQPSSIPIKQLSEELNLVGELAKTENTTNDSLLTELLPQVNNSSKLLMPDVSMISINPESNQKELLPIPSSVLKPAKIITTAPEGFDDLLQAQLTLMDVYFNGRLVGSSMATYTMDEIIFEEPKEVFTMLSDISQPDKVLAALSLPLPAHQSQVCFYQGQPDCGVLAPEELAVIFDESKLRVDIFINPDLQVQSVFEVDKYLPGSTSGPAMINALSLVASGGDTRDEVYTARINSIVSYENYRLLANVESDEQNDTRLDQLSVIYEYQDMEYQLGTFRTVTQNSGFFGQRDFIGLRAQSTLSSRTDLEQVSGTRLFVFLNERSRIEAYKDGQIIDTNLYQAGNIELDTREFPQGAYSVELKIIGESGRVRNETHFFSKSLQLPPKGESLFYLELGYPEIGSIESGSLEAYPIAEDESMTRLGYVTRLNDHFGLSGGYVNNSEQQSFEFGTFWLADRIDIQTNHLLTDDSETANFLSINYRHPNIFVSATYREANTKFLPLVDTDFRLLPESYTQSTLNFGIPFSNSMLNVFSRMTQREGQDSYNAIGLSWRKNIYRSGRFMLDWNIDASKENDDRKLLTGLTLRFSKSRFNLDSNLSYQDRNVAQQSQFNEQFIDKSVRVGYSNPDSMLGVVNHSLQLNQTREQDSATIQSSLNNDYGAGQVIVDRQRPSSLSTDNTNANKTNYSITGRFNLVTNGDDLAFGGAKQNVAGVMLDLKSFKNDELSFAVIVNGIERTRVKAGSSTFVALEPYKSYELVLSPTGQTLVEFNDTPKQFTLYPGNVKTYHWDIEQVKVIVLQLIKNEKPFSNSKLQDKSIYARTDDLGWVQLELKTAGTYRFKKFDGSICELLIEQNELIENVNYLGERNCQ
jgi:Mat/Ecp fimbriae outer membrane usher protein